MQNNEKKTNTSNKSNKISIESRLDQTSETKTFTHGNTEYLDASELKRPESLTIKSNKQAKIVIVFALAVALVLLCVICLKNCKGGPISASKVNEICSKNVDYNIPVLAKYLGKSLEDTTTSFENQGLNVVNITSENEPSNSYSLFKVPSTCSTTDAVDWFSKSVTSLSATELATLLNGGWEYTAGTTSVNYVRLKYADFKSSSIEDAIEKAKNTQNFQDVYVSGTDKDDIGNTYQTGTAKYNGKQISWRISALPLSEAYKQELPSGSIYVGIRVEG